MESMQRQASQPRRTPVQTPSDEPAQQDHLTSTAAHSTLTQDKDPIQDDFITATPTPPRFTSADDDPSVKKCWICFSDSTEDTAETSPWRDPCPCALVAHEQCLLDWIADAEVTKNARVGLLPGPIQCPQCKADIKLSRPHSYIVSAYKLADLSTNRMVMPVGVVTLSLNVMLSLTFAHGVHSIYRIFGTKDANEIFAPLIESMQRRPIDLTDSLANIWHEFLDRARFRLEHWRVFYGVPFITPVLFLSRVNHAYADAVLTVLPSVFFALQPSKHGEGYEFGRWPPSASMAFALLPYARQAYNMYYQRVWGEQVKKWQKEILPTTAQTQDDEAGGENPMQRIENAANGDAGNAGFEIRIDTGVWEEIEVPEEEPQAAVPEAEAEVLVDDAAPPPVVQDNRPAAQPQVQRRDERRLTFSPAEVAGKMLGALALPTIARLSGELLKLALPKSWTDRSASRGILQEKWGRSLIGGCLFVVLKDALTIYVRWKMAQMHRNRRVLDYDRSKGRAR